MIHVLIHRVGPEQNSLNFMYGILNCILEQTFSICFEIWQTFSLGCSKNMVAKDQIPALDTNQCQFTRP